MSEPKRTLAHGCSGFQRIAAGIIAVTGFAGCGADGGIEATEAAPGALEPAPEAATQGAGSVQRLAELTVGDSRVSFDLELVDGQPSSITLGETFGSVDRVSTLMQQHGALTSLEVFYALAPSGSEPPAALLAMHEGEARAFGRSPDELAPRLVDGRDLSIDKEVLPACQDSAFTDGPILPFHWIASEMTFNTVAIDGTAISTCLGMPLKTNIGAPSGCEAFHPSKMLRMTVCNNKTHTVSPISPFLYTEKLTFPFPTPLPQVTQSTSHTVTRMPPNPIPNPAQFRWMGIKATNAVPDSDGGNMYFIRGGVAQI